MRLGPQIFTTCFAALVLVACDAESIFGPESSDAGFFRLDSGQVTNPDSGPIAGAPDSGGIGLNPNNCPWPASISSCVMPPLDQPAFSALDQGITAQVSSMIACADNYIRAAFYETSWEAIVEAFAYRLSQDPDLVVELVIDDAPCPRENGVRTCPWSKIESHPRVTIVDDARSNLMHHKFIIVDGEMVWVGSANMTTSSFCNEVNDGIVINNPQIIAGFEDQFARHFQNREFGPVSPEQNQPITGGPYTVYFSPESPQDDSSPWFDALVAKIDASVTSIDFMIFAFTRPEVSDALQRAHARGVKVRGLISNLYAGMARAQDLRAAGVPVRKGKIHSKVMIVDKKTVIAGSANWSRNAWKNNETSLWIDDERISEAYGVEFERVFQLSVPISP